MDFDQRPDDHPVTDADREEFRRLGRRVLRTYTVNPNGTLHFPHSPELARFHQLGRRILRNDHPALYIAATTTQRPRRWRFFR